MFGSIDSLLDRITVYRLVLYYLIALLFFAFWLSVVHILPFSPLDLTLDTGLLIAVCWLFNALLSRLWAVPTNAESSLITALILALIIQPALPDVNGLLLVLAALVATISKYVISIRGRHLLNPAAAGAAIAAVFAGKSAAWWVGGSPYLVPLVLIGGYLIVRKTRTHDLVLMFLAAAAFFDILFVPFTASSVLAAVQFMAVHTPILFFGFAMLTEPLTTPPQRLGRLLYGGSVAFLLAPWMRISSLHVTPELALCAGNILSYIVSPKYKAILRLQDIHQIANDTYEYVFAGRRPHFKPGQHAEWTIFSPASDSRGNRRSFTIASAPTELNVRLGVRFSRPPSTFKSLFGSFDLNNPVLVGYIGGDFTLPWRKKRKLAFIACGIGVTPFRSMAKYMVDKREKRDCILLYANRSAGEIAYRELFDAAQRAGIGFRAVYAVTGKDVPQTWQGERGPLDAAMIQRAIPDYKKRLFYVSGPREAVESCVRALHSIGVSRLSIKKDCYSGFA